MQRFIYEGNGILIGIDRCHISQDCLIFRECRGLSSECTANSLTKVTNNCTSHQLTTDHSIRPSLAVSSSLRRVLCVQNPLIPRPFVLNHPYQVPVIVAFHPALWTGIGFNSVGWTWMNNSACPEHGTVCEAGIFAAGVPNCEPPMVTRVCAKVENDTHCVGILRLN